MPLAADLRLFAATDVGRRRHHNEDSFLVDRDLGLCIVADGMGGHAAGEIASAAAVETIHDELMRHRDALRDRGEQGAASGVSVKQLLTILEGSIHTASARIHSIAQGDAAKRGMGTTVSLLMVLDSLAYVAHVGDSRIYLERNGALRQITDDHTMAAEMLRQGMITEDRLDKVPHRNAITRAVGIYPHVKVDTFTLELLPGDRYIVASDGLTGYLKEADSLLSRLSEDGEQTVHGLVDYANSCGGKDNITVCLLQINRPEADDGSFARRLALKREMLSKVPLFSGLDQREIESITHVVDIVEHGAGEIVVRAGEPGDQLFIALSGRLNVRRGKTVLGSLGPGEHMGEMALIRTTPRSATVEAAERSELLTLRRRDFFEVIRTEPQVAVKLLWQFVLVLADRLEQTSSDLSRARDALAAEDISDQVVAIDPIADSEEARPTARHGIEADPFSVPPPTSLGQFRLGYVAGADGPIRQAKTVRELPRPGATTEPPEAPSAPDDGSSPGDEKPPTTVESPDATAVPRDKPAVEEGVEDMRITLPFVRGGTVRSGGDPGDEESGRQPGQLDTLRKEIDELRKEFKERLMKSRKAARKDDSD